jgi:large subunit ribosomal protein L9
MAEVEARRAELEADAAAALAAAEARKAQLDGLVLTIKAKAGNEGKLFGSVSSHEIADALKEAGIPVERREIRLNDGSLRHVGEFEVTLHLHTEVNVNIKVIVEAE